MSDAARARYAIDGKFPASVGPTPAKSSCCTDPTVEGGDKCVADAKNWQNESWLALDFVIMDPHYYRYEFVSSNEGGRESYTALAYGDLDCDGMSSTYSLYGEVVDGEVMSAPDIIKIDALE
ncbi:MAG: hypothetical protein GY811_03915 [Myxococcales bacterium]|nr:hypothetical protein [Myxococcales bacterium]